MSLLMPVVLLFALGPAPLPGDTQASPPPSIQEDSAFRPLSYQAALAAARDEDKKILAYFWTQDCKRCDAMDALTFSSPKARTWLTHRVVAVRIGPEAPEVAKALSVEGFPTVVFLDADGLELDRFEDFIGDGKLFEAGERIIGGKGGLATARDSLEEAPDDPERHLVYARALNNNRHGLEALEHFLWVFDHTRGDPLWAERRTGEVLRDLKVLGRGLSEVHRELGARRDAAAAKLLEGYDPETPEAELLLCAHEVRVLDVAISQVGYTFTVWDALRQREGFPKSVMDELFDVSVESRLRNDGRYADLLWAWGDPLVDIERRLAAAREQIAEAEPGSRFNPDSLMNGVASMAGRYYEALLMVGKEQDAAGLVEILLAFDPHPQFFVSLVAAAFKADRDDLTQELTARARATLEPGKDLDRFERVLGQLQRQRRR